LVNIEDGLTLLAELAKAFEVDFSGITTFEEAKELLVQNHILLPSFSMEDVVYLPRDRGKAECDV